MPFWSEPRSDQCNFLSLKLSTLCSGSALMNSFVPSRFDQSGVAVAGATNAANTRQREAVTVSLFIPPLHPHAFNPTTTTHGNFVLSPVLLASRDQDGGPSDSTIMQHLRSHGKIGDCEQSKKLQNLQRNVWISGNPRGGEITRGGYFPIRGYWGCAAGWGRIFTTGLTIMGLHF